ncbi:hypothetical protein RRF57_004362 [Xylaria bambusicola]|uniref:Major facilitator superfamily (MFS) profile domain-containing protein n=1 Tax=Xylaria bambusicola TaxID=326684 RepID=A0AAN7UNP1_9PEZI
MPESNTAVQSSHEDHLGDEKVKPTTLKSSSHDKSRRDSKSSQSIHSSGDSEDIDDVDQQDRLERCSTKHSAMGDASIQPIESVVQVPEEFYDRLPKHRKSHHHLVSRILQLVPLADFEYVGASRNARGCRRVSHDRFYRESCKCVIPLVYGLVTYCMGTFESSLTCLVTGTGFVLASIGTALAPNLGAFFFFRLFTAFLGTSFLLNGAAVISDIYKPTERGTATGWFMSGTLIGPAFGPFLGGLIVTYTSWRVIFWLQTGLAGVGTIGIFFFMPETIFHKKIDDLEGYSGREKGRALLSMLNPWGILKLFRYPRISKVGCHWLTSRSPDFILAGFASSSLVWNMYSILTPIRYVLNPRYNLTTPLQGGLFYLAPGFGYLTGTFVGGRYADYIVKVYIRKRGVRIPEDRMYSALPFLGFVLPGSVIIYGWCVEKDAGGIPLTVIVLFLQGLAQLFCFPSLNTYCLDVMSGRGAEVIAGNYAIRYLFGCVATAVVLPAIQSIGVGWFSTISTLFLLAGAVCTYLTVRYGERWRNDIDAKHKMNKLNGRKDKKNGASHVSTEKPANSSEV